MGTDEEWEKWGARDPYFGVLTNEKYRIEALDDARKKQFFSSGADHIERVMSRCKSVCDGEFDPKSGLDFGCGVGRTTIPLARYCRRVVGIDVSQSMLDEAARNAADVEITNVEFRKSDDRLSRVPERFDFIHSFIVLQHVPVTRGTRIFATLVDRIDSGGMAYIHLTYANKSRLNSLKRVVGKLITFGKKVMFTNREPEMQMNHYNLNDIFFILQSRKVTQVFVEYTDHGGELGIQLIFRMPI